MLLILKDLLECLVIQLKLFLKRNSSAYVYINGKRYEEDYIKSVYEYPSCPDKNTDPLILMSDQVMKCGPFKLDEDSYFMMGDKSWKFTGQQILGHFKRDRFVGRAVVVFWPLNRKESSSQIKISDNISYN